MSPKKDPAIEFERSIARAQSSLNRRDVQEFRAAIQELQKLVPTNGRWQSAVNFLARSIDPAQGSKPPLAKARV